MMCGMNVLSFSQSLHAARNAKKNMGRAPADLLDRSRRTRRLFHLKCPVLFGGELARSYVRQDLQRSSHRHSRNEDDPALFTRHKIGLSDNDRRYVYTMLLDARPSHDISNHRRCAALLTRCDCLHDVLVLGSTLLMLTPCFSHVLHCSNLVERVAR